MNHHNSWSRLIVTTTVVMAIVVFASSAFAHSEGAVDDGGLLIGFLHPVRGLDHILAMLAVGMWGAQLGDRALWALPVAFPLVMAVGGVFGILEVPIPQIELGIAVSVIGLGTLIAFRAKLPLWAAGIIVAFFAVFHGYAHGAELPGAAKALPYSLGFVVATGLIHLAGIGVGMVKEIPRGETALRILGGMVATAGAYILFGLFAGS